MQWIQLPIKCADKIYFLAKRLSFFPPASSLYISLFLCHMPSPLLWLSPLPFPCIQTGGLLETHLFAMYLSLLHCQETKPVSGAELRTIVAPSPIHCLAPHPLCDSLFTAEAALGQRGGKNIDVEVRAAAVCEAIQIPDMGSTKWRMSHTHTHTRPMSLSRFGHRMQEQKAQLSSRANLWSLQLLGKVTIWATNQPSLTVSLRWLYPQSGGHIAALATSKPVIACWYASSIASKETWLQKEVPAISPLLAPATMKGMLLQRFGRVDLPRCSQSNILCGLSCYCCCSFQCRSALLGTAQAMVPMAGAKHSLDAAFFAQIGFISAQTKRRIQDAMGASIVFSHTVWHIHTCTEKSIWCKWKFRHADKRYTYKHVYIHLSLQYQFFQFGGAERVIQLLLPIFRF